MTKDTKNGSKLYFKILKTWKNWESTRITSIPFPFLRIHFPFPVAKSQSQQPKSHFPSLKIDSTPVPILPLQDPLNSAIEKLHLKFCKRVLGVHSKSTNMAIYAELGRTPLIVQIAKLVVKYWFRTKSSLLANALVGKAANVLLGFI